ncbi:helix-turn-helix domain-containing protein [Salinithrix halophila]|uniref:Helix-turn-helix domain-containing protein n=1 Tax=Salinithrix halophila TaxID=1485204 RepID=A0ABV8JJD1_9BACL
MTGIGSQLRQTRESMGYTLDQVQQSTKIHIEYLRALENDQFETLPSAFYVRAFLRTYAHSLGLDAQPLLDRYERASVNNRAPRRGMDGQARQNRGVAQDMHQGLQTQPQPQPRLGRTYSPRSQRMDPPTRAPQQAPPYGNQPQQPSPGEQAPPIPPQRTSRFRALPEDGMEAMPQQSMPQPSMQGPSQPPKQQTGFQQTQPQSVSQTTMVPRRVQQEVNRGMADGDGKAQKKTGARTWIIRAAAIGALILVPVGGWLWYTGGDQTATNADTTESEESSDNTVNAKVPETTSLNKVETGGDIEGDLFALKGADKVEIEIKANNGSSGLAYGYETNNQKENFTLKTGEKRVLEDKDFIWFRLFKPSNTEIKVNGQDIDTTAQDVPKSYRIKLEK